MYGIYEDAKHPSIPAGGLGGAVSPPKKNSQYLFLSNIQSSMICMPKLKFAIDHYFIDDLRAI